MISGIVFILIQAMLSGPADLVQVVRACSSVAETCPADDDVEPKAKRAKKHVHLDCIRFYFDNCDILAERNKRSRAHCLRNLTEMAPEIYGKVHSGPQSGHDDPGLCSTVVHN